MRLPFSENIDAESGRDRVRMGRLSRIHAPTDRGSFPDRAQAACQYRHDDMKRALNSEKPSVTHRCRCPVPPWWGAPRKRGPEPCRTLGRGTTPMSDTDHVIDLWAEQSQGDGHEQPHPGELRKLRALGWPYQQPIQGSHHGTYFTRRHSAAERRPKTPASRERAGGTAARGGPSAVWRTRPIDRPCSIG
jgi:hypothetical protein